MRTSVETNEDPDDTDEFPGCGAQVDDQRRLLIVDFERDGVIETTYERGDWTAATIINE